jgi:hypothetical protein
MRPASRATRCCRSSCALHMRASLVDAGRLVAHPRTIKEIMHASPIDRRLIENHTTTNLTAQRKSPAEGLPGRGLLRFRGDVKFRLEACRSTSSVPQAPTSRVRPRANGSSDASSRRSRSPRPSPPADRRLIPVSFDSHRNPVSPPTVCGWVFPVIGCFVKYHDEQIEQKRQNF